MLPPLTGMDGRRGVVIENRAVGPDDGPTRAHPRPVTINYLKAVGATIREGRGFLPSEAKPGCRSRSSTKRWPNAIGPAHRRSASGFGLRIRTSGARSLALSAM
jgi:hypothetical protein